MEIVEKKNEPVIKKFGHGGARPNTGGRREGAGRKPGVPNKISGTVKEAILRSFEEVGSYKYLVKMSAEQPQAYMTLLGKILPTQVDMKIDKPIEISFKVVGETKE